MVTWVGLAIVISILTTKVLRGSFPIFTLVWLVVPLLIVIRAHDAHRVGFIRISWRMFLATTAINLALLLLVSLIVEPWSHAYRELVKGAISASPPDTTFAWLVRFTGVPAWGGMLLYSGLVSIFGEELFFRGWLLQSLQRKMNKQVAIVIQSSLFTIPQSLAAFLLTPLQGLAYAIM